MKDTISTLSARDEVWNVFGERIVCRVRGEESFGRFALVEETSPAGGSVPPHRHRATDEIIYVLEGVYEIAAGAEKLTVEAGDTFAIPRGTTHSLRNLSAGPGRFLAIVTPSGFERFFAEISRLAPHELNDAARIAAVAARHDIELVGPAES